MDSSNFPMDSIIEEVLLRLEHMSPEVENDVYVWSDGSVTFQEEPESRVGGLKLVSLFTPKRELPTAEAIRASIEHGLETVD